MVKLFFSYSHEDEDLRNKLETHLALLKREKLLSVWHDRRITAGSEFDTEISSNLESSDIILLLVSADFIASEYCYNREMTRAIQKHQDGSAVVIPVILRPCDWTSAPFGHLMATPKDGKAVLMFANQDEAFSIIVKDIRAAANSLQKPATNSSAGPLGTISRINGSLPARSSNLRIKKRFSDLERDDFLNHSFEYIAQFFQNSLSELDRRNSHITTKFKRDSATRFSVYIYDSGQAVVGCSIFHMHLTQTTPDIAFSYSTDARQNSFNESISVVNDGYTLQLEPSGMQTFVTGNTGILSQEGAAEHFWSLFIKRLQE
ncbi:MAG: toll/interleukin-1 receptor domain-containing protein [Deltaproteobacteria bacterium]|nr:toll/interleukin-1 receptor domain-containing protein [Deltaproteobacteria bacterium]